MRVFERLRNLFFPPKCVACGSLLDWHAPIREALCPSCRKKWVSEKLDCCEICAKRVTDCCCVTEQMKKAKAVALKKLCYYRHGEADAVQNRIVFSMKRMRDTALYDFLAQEFLPVLQNLQQEYSFDLQDTVITFIPRGHTAKLEQGVDQAEELARALSKSFKTVQRRLIARRPFKSRQQKRLSPAERVKNAKASFRLARGADVKNKTVLLVDDVVTTGAGMAVCSSLLYRAGARAVYCVAVASDDANRNSVSVDKF